MKDMSAEELISYRDDIREFMSVENKEDVEFYNKASAELLSRLKTGERAVKAMEEIVGASKDSPCTPLWVERIELIIDQWRQGNE